MLAIFAALFAFSVSWPRTYYGANPPETDEQWADRMRRQALAVAEVSTESGFRAADAAALVETVWGYESAFEYYVHAGGISPIGDQDGGLARCMGQIHTWPGNKHLPTKADHQALAGTDEEATRRCAQVTLAYFWGHAQRCLRVGVRKDRWARPLEQWEAAKLFAAYGAGQCVPVAKRHKGRALTFSRLRAQIWQQLAYVEESHGQTFR